MTEVCSVVDVSQFQSGHSTEKCGFYVVSLLKYAGQSGLSGNAGQVAGWADSTYIRYDGPDSFSNQNGMTVPTLYAVIQDAGLHYQAIGARETGFQVDHLTADYIRAWVRAGYPVVLSVAEDDVWDCDLNEKPYSWDTTNFYHIILCTGVSGDNNLLCHDTANIGPLGVRSGPRRYDATRLQAGLTSATAVVLPWMTRPDPTFDPTKQTQKQEEPTMAVTMNDATMQQYFSQSGDHIIRKDKPDIFIFGANASFYMKIGGVAVCGLPTACEFYPQDGVAILPCERVLIVYDPQRKRDNPPIAGDNYLEHIDSLQGEIDTLKTELAAAQQPALQAQITALHGKLTQIFAICQAD